MAEQDKNSQAREQAFQSFYHYQAMADDFELSNGLRTWARQEALRIKEEYKLA